MVAEDVPAKRIRTRRVGIGVDGHLEVDSAQGRQIAPVGG
jgi:hypothetical protein